MTQRLEASAAGWMVVIFCNFFLGTKKILGRKVQTGCHFKITNLNKHLGHNVSLIILGIKYLKESRF